MEKKHLPKSNRHLVETAFLSEPSLTDHELPDLNTSTESFPSDCAPFFSPLSFQTNANSSSSARASDSLRNLRDLSERFKLEGHPKFATAAAPQPLSNLPQLLPSFSSFQVPRRSLSFPLPSHNLTANPTFSQPDPFLWDQSPFL